MKEDDSHECKKKQLNISNLLIGLNMQISNVLNKENISKGMLAHLF
jgi:hypothetical protein